MGLLCVSTGGSLCKRYLDSLSLRYSTELLAHPPSVQNHVAGACHFFPQISDKTALCHVLLKLRNRKHRDWRLGRYYVYIGPASPIIKITTFSFARHGIEPRHFWYKIILPALLRFSTLYLKQKTSMKKEWAVESLFGTNENNTRSLKITDPPLYVKIREAEATYTPTTTISK
ncbi:hypothetical protein GMOD_00002638 [Pyrenophora seminiperda CCB06]|uniref:Uncharacterized protein n=1 Tax=Pyrenophora seminiperda CCB06 TaxID=1302712 RepID=A0A3M7M2Z4_9PLEO|nr:hypothetical protein GMOD_00002638 [Pyrenophora seminiperda CCB06]